jgi:hypothetical protein
VASRPPLARREGIVFGARRSTDAEPTGTVTALSLPL